MEKEKVYFNADGTTTSSKDLAETFSSSLAQAKTSLNVMVETTEAMKETLLLFLQIFPSFCPKCDYTHESTLWIANADENLQCSSCGYILQDKDCWFSEIDA